MLDPAPKEGALLPCLTETAIIRFLRGEDHDTEKCISMITKYLQWRMSINADYIDPNSFKKESDKKKFECGPNMRSLDGRPIMYYFGARHNKNDRDVDMIKAQVALTMDTLVFLYSIPKDERITAVIDLGNLSFSNMDYEVIKEFAGILQNNYSDTLNTALIVDPPMLFSACWAIIKPWLDPVVAAKIRFIKRGEIHNFIDMSINNKNNVPLERMDKYFIKS